MNLFRVANLIKQDLNRFTPIDSFVAKLKCILFVHSFHLVMLYRIGGLLASLPFVGSLLRVLWEYLIRIVYASDISLKSKIGGGLIIMHGHDIVIGSSVSIGQNCKILNGVTIGNKDTETIVNQQPTIGDGVVIGSGAKILGDIIIGNDVVIGANSVVTTSFPSNVVVAGIPGKVIRTLNHAE